MSEPSKSARQLKALRQKARLSVRAVAKHVGKGASSYQHYEDGYKKRYLPQELVEQLVPLFTKSGIQPGELMALAGPLGGTLETTSSDQSTIPEVDVKAGAGGGGLAQSVNITDENGNTVETDDVKTMWGLPHAYIRNEIGVSPNSARIIEVIGDSMTPTMTTGGRAMVDTSDRTPSPPGIFALWDGLGLVVKRIEHIPNSDPTTLRILSDNPQYEPYERTAEEVNIIGRVVWYARRM